MSKPLNNDFNFILNEILRQHIVSIVNTNLDFAFDWRPGKSVRKSQNKQQENEEAIRWLLPKNAHGTYNLLKKFIMDMKKQQNLIIWCVCFSFAWTVFFRFSCTLRSTVVRQLFRIWAYFLFIFYGSQTVSRAYVEHSSERTAVRWNWTGLYAEHSAVAVCVPLNILCSLFRTHTYLQKYQA